LLVSDKLFRAKDIAKRKLVNDLIKKVEKKGGDHYIFSSAHVSGQKLDNLTGIACILRFPLTIASDDEDDDDDENDGKANENEDEERKEG
jgi:protein pelota